MDEVWERLFGPRAELIDELIVWTEIKPFPADTKLTIKRPKPTAYQKKPLLQDKFPSNRLLSKPRIIQDFVAAEVITADGD